MREKLRQARGHEEQLDIFTREYRTASLKYAQRLACEHFTAEDVVHTMLCKIAARMAAHRDQVCRAWIIVCLRNASRDLRRKYRLPLAALDPEQEAQALDDFNEAHLEQVLQIIFAKLRRSVGADPIDRALFEDWVHYRLDRETDETALRELCGSHLSVRRHRFAKQYDPKLARMLSSAYDVDRLAEIQQALIRRRSKRRQCSEDERQPRARSQ